MAQQQSQLLLGALEKLGGAGPGVTRDGCPRSLIFLIFHGSPLPFSFASFQNISFFLIFHGSPLPFSFACFQNISFFLIFHGSPLPFSFACFQNISFFLIFHGSPLPFSFACFQNISSAFFGCLCFREAKILKEPVTESPEQFSTQRFTGVPSFWWVVKKTRGVGCFRSAAMTAFSRLPIKFRRCGKYLLFLSVP